MSKGYVYILRSKNAKRVCVKIGRAGDVTQRLRPMLTANPWLEVYVKVYTSKWVELESAVKNIIKLVSKNTQYGNSEFYFMEPETAKCILLEFSRLFDKEDFKIFSGDGAELKTKVRQRRTQQGQTLGAWKNPTQLAKAIAAKYNNGKAAQHAVEILSGRFPVKRGTWRNLLTKIGVEFNASGRVVDWSKAKV